MTVKIIGSATVVEHVFWLDLRRASVGVKLRDRDGHEWCAERPLADFVADGGKQAGACGSRDCVEIALGERAQVILRDDG